MSKPIQVTVHDLETGETIIRLVEPGDYALICGHPCRLEHAQHYGNGTVTLNLKGHRCPPGQLQSSGRMR